MARLLRSYRRMKRMLIGGVGYQFLRDFSFGPEMIRRLQELDWPSGVDIEDLSYGPVTVVQNLTDQEYERMILVGAHKRGGTPGSLNVYHLSHELPEDDVIQERVGEAVTGVISLDNLLIVGRHFGALPDDVLVFEVEPLLDSWGEGFSETVESAMLETMQRIRAEVGLGIS